MLRHVDRIEEYLACLLLDTIAGAMQGVAEEIVLRQIDHFYRADPAYGEGVARRMGVEASEARAAQAA